MPTAWTCTSQAMTRWFATNAPRLRLDAVEAAVPWQPMDALELVLAYAKIKRSDVSAAPFPLIEGDLLQLQLQLQLQIKYRVLQPDEAIAPSCAGARCCCVAGTGHQLQDGARLAHCFGRRSTQAPACYRAASSARMISAPALRAVSLPFAMCRARGAIPQLVDG